MTLKRAASAPSAAQAPAPPHAWGGGPATCHLRSRAGRPRTPIRHLRLRARSVSVAVYGGQSRPLPRCDHLGFPIAPVPSAHRAACPAVRWPEIPV